MIKKTCFSVTDYKHTVSQLEDRLFNQNTKQHTLIIQVFLVKPNKHFLKEKENFKSIFK